MLVSSMIVPQSATQIAVVVIPGFQERKLQQPRIGTLYEFYHDVIRRGQYTFHIREMHKKYGPILRISPYELHITDPSFIHEIYAVSNRRRDRWEWSTRPGGFNGSVGGTNPHELHRKRRAALNPFFSKASIRKLQHEIDEKAVQLVQRLRNEKERVFKVNHAYAALTNDIIMRYAFAREDNRSAHKDFDPSFHDNFVAGVSCLNLLRHVSWLDRAARSLPMSVLSLFSSVIAQFWEEKQTITEEVRQILNGTNKAYEEQRYRTIYHGILNSKLPEEEKSLQRLAEEAQITVGAGTLATAWVMSVGMYHLLAPGSVSMFNTLRKELKEAIPDPNEPLDWNKLEKLPFLTGVVKESLRLGNGTTTRLQRIAPDETLIYKDPNTGKVWEIPPGTPVSLTSLHIHHDEKIFADPESFRPERWIENPELEQYLLTFSKGSRQCVGMHLAYCEMYIVLARIFRSFGRKDEDSGCDKVGNLELFETDERDTICVADLVVPTIVAYQVVIWIYNAWFHPLSVYPGPKLFAVSYIPSLYYRILGDYVQVHVKFHDRYGDVVRVSPSELSYINAQAWKDISGQGLNRPDMEKDPLSFGRPLPGMPSIFNANRVDHGRIRRTMSHAFSAVALRKQEPLIRDHVKLLIKCLKEHKGDVVDMVSWYNFTTFDMFGDLAFGETFGCLTNSTYHPWVGMLIMSMKAGYFIIQSQKYPLLEKALLYMIPASLRQRKKDHLSLTQERVANRIAKQTDRPDFLSFILKHEDSTGLTRPELEMNASTLIVAGSETTATLLSGCTYYLLRNPHVMKKVIDEIRQSFKTEEDIDITGVNKLKYMLAVLDEALRMYPPAPGNFHRVVPDEGAVVCGKVVPGGSKISVCHYAAYRSPRNFYKPDSFIPERFLGESGFENDQKDVLQPFGIGSRACLGRNLAYFEMRLILAQVLWNFDLELMPESTDWSHQKVYAIWEKSPLYVKLKPRSIV
ncbi:hypothetical protein TCE0_015f02743 [Talaromyces pinophilus]|uniref:Cytochrome P450 n=1 Tax=Talaromyces pinophilus TaxID=128442 RepID=A0A6V8H1L9_TALPI|nr:hypothetical protein TCE0_015f02743 [Talaromyces pinophilus]